MNIDLQILANTAIILGLLLTLLEIIDTWLDIREKLNKLRKKPKSNQLKS